MVVSGYLFHLLFGVHILRYLNALIDHILTFHMQQWSIKLTGYIERDRLYRESDDGLHIKRVCVCVFRMTLTVTTGKLTL